MREVAYLSYQSDKTPLTVSASAGGLADYYYNNECTEAVISSTLNSATPGIQVSTLYPFARCGRLLRQSQSTQTAELTSAHQAEARPPADHRCRSTTRSPPPSRVQARLPRVSTPWCVLVPPPEWPSGMHLQMALWVCCHVCLSMRLLVATEAGHSTN
jgi:hypothetical protein